MFSYDEPMIGEPTFDSVEELRLFRKRRVALGYRVFAALGWGRMSDGHITARDAPPAKRATTWGPPTAGRGSSGW